MLFRLCPAGDEDGCAKVWDERYGEMPLVVMHWHKKPITVSPTRARQTGRQLDK